MTASAIVAIIRDSVIVVALGWLVWMIKVNGENGVKLENLRAVQQQLTENTQTLSRWAKDAQDAETQRKADTDKINQALAAHNQPVIVRVPSPAAAPSARDVSANSTPASRHPPASRPADGGCGSDRQTVDLRPAISAFERKYEATLADCRAALAQWPTAKPPK